MLACLLSVFESADIAGVLLYTAFSHFHERFTSRFGTDISRHPWIPTLVFSNFPSHRSCNTAPPSPVW